MLTLDRLEDRIVPSTLTVDAGDINNPTPPAGNYSLVGAINQANTDSANGIADTISLTNGTYTFSSVNNTTNGANLLPLITATNLTIQGNGSTLNGASLGRFFDVGTGAGLTLDNLTLTSGEASGANAQGGAIFNSGGNVTLNTIIAGGNQVTGGTGQNAQGGAIFSNGGSLTLSKDIIGQKATDSYNASFSLTNHATLGAANKATGGTAQGAGLYVSGGTVKISNCTFAADSATGGAGDNAQGGGLYSNGATLDLSKDLIGLKVIKTSNSTNKHTSIGGVNKAVGGVGADAQGAGLYVSGGTVNVTNCTVSNNQAQGVTGSAGVVGGSAQGGGIYANAATLTVSGGSVNVNSIYAGNGGAGTAKSVNGFTGRTGGSAQGGGIYAYDTTLTLSGVSVSNNGGFAGGGGTGAAGTVNHVTGGAGGAGGIVQGGGVFAQGGSLTITNSATVLNNSVGSGRGGNGGTGYTNSDKGGSGGVGGNAAGGGVYADQTPVLIEGGAHLNYNIITAGGGGSGVGGANGGAGGSAQGGGLFALNGTVSLESSTQVEANSVTGGAGGNGGNGVAGALAGGNGGNGGNGGAIDGGGVFASGGNVTITSASITSNNVENGNAGNGGQGGANTAKSGIGGAGGAGGNLGTGAGGGLYIAGTNLTVNVSNVTLSFNNAGSVGYAGHGGAGGQATGVKGQGGAGGQGGDSEAVSGGGAAIVGANTVTLTGVTVDHNNVQGGGAEVGGSGGAGAITSGIGGVGGVGGNGGIMQGGGLFVGGGTLNINGGSSFENNRITGSGGGAGGLHGAPLTTTVTHANGGNGSESLGGGLAVTGTAVTLDAVAIANNMDFAGEGGSGGGAPNSANTTGHRGNGGNGGNGGLGQGGGLYAANGSLTIQNGTTITTNALIGEPGGSGGGADKNAGYLIGTPGSPGTIQGAGMAVSNMTAPVSFTNSTIDSNLLDSGVGNNGMNGPTPPLSFTNPIDGVTGLTGGVGQGAGLFVQGSTFNATNGFFTNNIVAINNGGNGYSPQTKSAQQYIGGNGGNGGSGGTAQGGGVFATSSTLSLTSSTLSGNTLSVDNGGVAGLGFHGTNKTGVAVASANGVAGNGGSGGSGQGAGLFVTGSSGVTLLDTSVASNTTNIGLGGNGVSPGNAEAGGYGGTGGSNGNGQGGGVYANSSTTLKITNSTLADNVLNIDNGGNGGNGNVGGAGGAAGVATSKNLSPTSGSAQGGGLFAGASTLTLVNDTLANNALNAGNGGAGGNGSNGAGGNGGAGGTLGVTGQGGGLFLTGGTISAINDTIAANSVVVDLGGAAGTGTSSGTAGVNGTNFVAQAGGLYNDPTNSDSVTLENTVIALDTVLSSANDIFGTIASSDHDFIGNGTGATFTASSGDQIGTSTSPLNPDLGPLANYGGPTLTMMPINGSPVIGNGDTGALTAIATAENTTTANATDQRGYARSVNSLIDIGADEFQPGLSISGTATPASVQAGSNITYTLTVTNPGQFAIDGLSLTDTLPTNTTFVSMTTPSGWTATTPAVGQTGTVTATTTSLAGGQSVTFTLVVQVNTSVTGGTTIQNTATVTPTQSGVQLGNASVTLSTTVGSSLVNITNEIGIYETPILRDHFDGANSYIQAMLLVNNSGATITGPVALVLTGLPAGVTLTNASGTYNGSPYITLEPSNGSWQTGWWNFLFVFLEFNDPSGARITYTPEIVQGL